MPAERHCDVVIVGGGMVGATLAVALADSGLSLVVVEAVALQYESGDDTALPPSATQQSFDERTIALTYNARQIYSDIGVWKQISIHAQPIREIHVSERGRFGMTHLHHSDVGVDALGYVVPTRAIGKILHERMQQSDNIALHCPATVEHLQQREHDNVVTLSQNQEPLTLTAKLVVLADGGRSPLAKQIGITTHASAYHHSAVLSLINTDREHHGRAYERFTSEGPLALLPHSKTRYALVWTTRAEQVAARMALSDTEFIAELQTTFGDRAGNFSHPSARKCYPLQRARIDTPISKRVVIIGDAAHSVHPVAGQGFNLGLRDVAALAEIIHHAAHQNQDIATPTLLADYAQRRTHDTQMVSGFTDGLIRVFGSSNKPLGWARNLALTSIELFPPAKRFLLRRTMGLSNPQ